MTCIKFCAIFLDHSTCNPWSTNLRALINFSFQDQKSTSSFPPPIKVKIKAFEFFFFIDDFLPTTRPSKVVSNRSPYLRIGPPQQIYFLRLLCKEVYHWRLCLLVYPNDLQHFSGKQSPQWTVYLSVTPYAVTMFKMSMSAAAFSRAAPHQ